MTLELSLEIDIGVRKQRSSKYASHLSERTESVVGSTGS